MSIKENFSKRLVEDITTGGFFGGGVGLIMGNRHNDKVDMKNLIQSNKQENAAPAAPSTPSR